MPEDNGQSLTHADPESSFSKGDGKAQPGLVVHTPQELRKEMMETHRQVSDINGYDEQRFEHVRDYCFYDMYMAVNYRSHCTGVTVYGKLNWVGAFGTGGETHLIPFQTLRARAPCGLGKVRMHDYPVGWFVWRVFVCAYMLFVLIF